MKTIGIIPSRYESSRLPGKPLVDINGKSMVQRVFEQVSKSALDTVIVATDDDRIYQHVLSFGGRAIMTSKDHSNGTERCAEVIEKLEDDYDIAINIQGDEPFIHPEQINQVNSLCKKEGVIIGTLIKKIETIEELLDPDAIKKVVVNSQLEAIYFSRSPIPYLQGVNQANWLEKQTYYKHIGIYGFKTKTLKEVVQLPPSINELAESLEQLRWLDNGLRINTEITEHESPSVDTEKDLDLARNFHP